MFSLGECYVHAEMDITGLPFNAFIGIEHAQTDEALLHLLSGPRYLSHLGTVHAREVPALAKASRVARGSELTGDTRPRPVILARSFALIAGPSLLEGLPDRKLEAALGPGASCLHLYRSEYRSVSTLTEIQSAIVRSQHPSSDNSRIGSTSNCKMCGMLRSRRTSGRANWIT